MSEYAETIEAEDEWEEDVWLVARRMALLFYHMCQGIISTLGEEHGYRLIKECVWQYGQDCGRLARRVVERSGKPLNIESLASARDLPTRGWRRQTAKLPCGGVKTKVTFCPLASTWKQLGAEQLGRMYCFVDQAKAQSYNPELECVHESNCLDGDDFCEVVLRKKRGG